MTIGKAHPSLVHDGDQKLEFLKFQNGKFRLQLDYHRIQILKNSK